MPRIELVMGPPVESHIQFLLDMANDTGQEWSGSWNGADIVAKPGGDPAKILKKWRKELER